MHVSYFLGSDINEIMKYKGLRLQTCVCGFRNVEASLPQRQGQVAGDIAGVEFERKRNGMQFALKEMLEDR